eukprot:GDKI01026182.1.p1 GENE.GDKI01026182.1~~GDKI01026182.1.p1  ORF type:complete len:295 (-),score=105.35 GDKI01026182.1:228-1112(-)
MGGPSNSDGLSFPQIAACAGIGACSAEFCTIPMDTTKVRMQINTGSGPRPGFVGTLSQIVREEGIRAPWKGITAGFQRQLVYGTLRIAWYEPIRDFYCGKENAANPPLLGKIAAGLTSGGLAMLIANPTDLVKIRLQADARRAPGVPPRYKGSLDAYVQIAKTEGIKGLWTGVGPNIVRNSVINAAEMAAYDQIKQVFVKNKVMEEGLPLHFTAGLGAGFFATVVGSPVDVMKTRIMNAKPGQYSSALDCFKQTAKEGPMAFYKGFAANFMRIGSFNVAVFVFFEQLKNAARTL